MSPRRAIVIIVAEEHICALRECCIGRRVVWLFSALRYLAIDNVGQAGFILVRLKLSPQIDIYLLLLSRGRPFTSRQTNKTNDSFNAVQLTTVKSSRDLCRAMRPGRPRTTLSTKTGSAEQASCMTTKHEAMETLSHRTRLFRYMRNMI